jgi:hypothetical protein
MVHDEEEKATCPECGRLYPTHLMACDHCGNVRSMSRTGLRDMLEELFKRKFPEAREVMVMDPEHNNLVALSKNQTLGFALSHITTDECLLLDMDKNRIYEVTELTTEELAGRIEVVNTDMN